MKKKVHLSPHLDEWWIVVRGTIDKIQGWRGELPAKSGLALEGWADFVPNGLSYDFLIWTTEIASALAGQTDPEDYLPEWMPRIMRVNLQPIYRAVSLVLAWSDLQDRAWAQDHEGVMRILVGLPDDDELDDLSDAIERLCGIKLGPKLPAVGTSNDPSHKPKAPTLAVYAKTVSDLLKTDKRPFLDRIAAGEVWAFRQSDRLYVFDYDQLCGLAPLDADLSGLA